MLSAREGGGTVAVRFRPGAPRWCASVFAAAVLVVAGCSAVPAAEHRLAQDAAAYWDRTRLLAALPFGLGGRHLPRPGQSADSRTAGARAGLRVGALFEHGPTGNHFCTASVVSSPGKNLLITAAHCINGGRGSSGYDSDIVFIPDYRDGQEPFGVWTPAKLIVAPQWSSSSDPDFDVGFVVLEPHDGKNIEQILGASQLGTDAGYQYLVHVTGYPDSENVPITCVNWTSRFSDSQLKFECAGYTGGTSGSPWVTKFIAGSHTGTIVGVIGGYQEGGDTPSLSYSVRFGPAVLALYRQAVTAGAAVAQPAGGAS
jgi:V8-like Glu-specific endopeptidase